MRIAWSERLTVQGIDQETPVTATRTTPDEKWSTARPVPHPAYAGPVNYSPVEVAAGPGMSGALLWNSTGGPLSSRTAFRPPIKAVSSTVPATAALAGSTPKSTVWNPKWTLNQRADSWKLTLTDNTSGRIVEWFSGRRTNTVNPKWNGRDSASTSMFPPNGPLAWRLTAHGPSSAVETTIASGTVTVTGGAAVHRDFGARTGTPDGIGDLFQTTASGSLRVAYGSAATGNFSGSATTTGWPKGVLPVPVGTLDGDRCNDVLMRMPDGTMRAYTPACGAALKPATKHTVLGKGWNAYDVITSPGDLTGDGRADVVARDPKSGALYSYTARGGKLDPRLIIGTGYKGFKKIVGAGDLNGDRLGDLLLQDASNGLWRMYGAGGGKFGPLRLVAKDWGASYNAVVGAGDLTGDGRADLVVRDTAGTIWRLNGTGQGTFGKPAKLGTGWQVYNRLS
ncbi:VCBS repeat-containing protein [Streptomyces sp. NPDC097619]|uniref:FG-GAP repeat domain-containing protein n=1 Tax=Streptomyces sp. NPDC097619 TaxID=3157228 RepID=UPI00331D73A5